MDLHQTKTKVFTLPTLRADVVEYSSPAEMPNFAIFDSDCFGKSYFTNSSLEGAEVFDRVFH